MLGARGAFGPPVPLPSGFVAVPLTCAFTVKSGPGVYADKLHARSQNESARIHELLHPSRAPFAGSGGDDGVVDPELKEPSTNVAAYRARWCLRGDLQTEGADYDETFSPTLTLRSVRLLAAWAAHSGLPMRGFDFQASASSFAQTRRVKAPTSMAARK